MLRFCPSVLCVSDPSTIGGAASPLGTKGMPLLLICCLFCLWYLERKRPSYFIELHAGHITSSVGPINSELAMRAPQSGYIWVSRCCTNSAYLQINLFFLLNSYVYLPNLLCNGISSVSLASKSCLNSYWQLNLLGKHNIPVIKSRNFSSYAIRCWGYRGSIISHPKLTNPTFSCIHPSTHNQETFGNHLPQPSKSIRYTSYGNTPELPPQYWVASRLSHQQLHKRDFRCRWN